MEPYLSYSQSTGVLKLHEAGRIALLGTGWAGHGKGKNNPAMQTTPNVGPLPRGWYAIGEPQTHKVTGPYSLRLTPEKGNQMFGRDGFLIHGASKDDPGQESRGCIILARSIREEIHRLGVQRLVVTV